MKFHNSVFGSNVSLNDDRNKARRTNDDRPFDGIVFSEVPVSEPIAVEVQASDKQWKGGLIIGVTSTDPTTIGDEKVPLRFSYPFGLCCEKNVWLRPLRTKRTVSRFILVLTSKKELMILTSNESSVVILSDLPGDPLWLIVDLFGNVKSFTFLDCEDAVVNIPQNIMSMGPDSVNEFSAACKGGTIKYNSGRVFFVGPLGTGKSSLKNALFSKSFEEEEKALDTSCVCFSNGDGEWKSIVDEPINLTDEEVNDALAFNIVKSIVTKRRRTEEEVTPSCNPSDIVKSALRITKKSPIDINDTEVNEIISGFSENVKELVRKYLSQFEENDDLETSSLTSNSANNTEYVKYNLWDFSGNALYMITNQVVLTAFAVYVLVIDVSEDLDTPLCQSFQNLVELRKKDYTTLQLVHHWLTTLHSQVGAYNISSTFSDEEHNGKSEEACSSSPRVIIVGTHRNSVHLEPLTRDQMIKETFDKIEQSLQNKPYRTLVHPKYLAIDCAQMSCDEPLLLTEIRTLIDAAFADQKLIGFEIPYSWIELEQIIKKLVKRGIYFADFRQLHEVTRSNIDQFSSVEALQMALDFFHSQGTIYCFSSNYLGVSETLVILDPTWLLSFFHRLCDAFHVMTEDDKDAFFTGIFKENVIDVIWKHNDHKMMLIGCLERLDIVCELCPYVGAEEAPDVAASAMQAKMYIFPWICQTLPESLNGVGLEYDMSPENSLELAIDFNGLLPIGLFTRFSVRLCRWSWNQGWGRRPEVCHSETRVAVDFDHDLLIKIIVEKNKFKLFVIKIYEGMQNDQNTFSGPTPNTCVKVRHLIETELEIIQNSFYRRVTYSLQVPCPCDLVCEEHSKSGCQQPECIHYLPLNECLSNKVVECDYRQVRTNFVQKYFPQASFYCAGAPNYVAEHQLTVSESTNGNFYEIVAGWENIFNMEPMWMKEASKMLFSNPGRDWISLAKRLGYSDRDITKLVEEVTPALALLRDWYESNGRTRYCIDVLLSCLRMISREDIVTVIESDMEPEGSAPPIFISYQWDSQELVLDLRRRLELAGFPCWMDVGLLAGGDSLYGKIYEGVSRAKVVVCCLTPRYVVSRLCTREVTLADVLHKPILPIMLEPTPWPPPGPMAVIMSSLVYIDLCSIGAHGGIGKRGDSETRFRDIIDRIARYLSGYVDAPLIPRNFPVLDLFSPIRNVTPQISALPTNTSELPTPSLAEQPAAEASNTVRETQNLAEDNFSEDSISVLSQTQHNNRISNCSICCIL